MDRASGGGMRCPSVLRRVLRSLVGVGALTISSSARPETPAVPRAMTLPEAIAYAQSHHPDLVVAHARVTAAATLADVPTARWLPKAAAGLEFSLGTTNNSTASYLPLPNVGLPRIGATPVTSTPNFAPEPSTLVGIGLSQQLFDFGRTAALSALATAALEVTRMDAEVRKLDVQFAVARSYFAVLTAHEIVRASEQAFDRALVHRDEARAKVEAGLRAQVDLTRADADLAHYSVGLTRAQGGLAIAESAFAAAVGLTDAWLDARGSPPPLPPLPSVTEALRLALQRQPELRVGAARIQAARAETRSLRAESAPDARVDASLSARAGGADPSSGPGARYGGFVPETPNWDAAVILSWPFADPVRDAQRRAAEAREGVATASLGSLRSDLMARIHQAHDAARLAETSLSALERARDAARANYQQAEARFNGGLATTVELADAEALRTQSEIDLAIGQFAVLSARALLSQLMGAAA